MYPLHKYVPTPFGTYLMYINHGKERITVENFPKDMKSFTKELARNAKTHPENKTNVSGSALEGARKQEEVISQRKSSDIRPSYQIHFLEHTGQAITEPPPNVIIVDDITGADVTSSMTWIRNRPQRWKDRLKLHEIENPKMTSTVKQSHVTPEKQTTTEERFLPTFKEPQIKGLGPKHGRGNLDYVRSSMLPHITKPIRPRQGREKREEREIEARKRRRKVDKIMNIVTNRAKVAQIKSQNSPDKLFEIQDTKTSMYLTGSMPDQQRSVSVGSSLTRKSKRQLDNHQRSSSELSNAQLRSRATIYEKKKPQRIQDWNPKEEHQVINRIVLERLEATLPYKWNTQNIGDPKSKETAPSPLYHYVL